MPTLDEADLQSIAQIVSHCSGTVYFVSQSGNDADDGKSWATAFATGTQACSVAVAGDVIQFGAGTWAHSVQFSPADGVIVKGAGIDVTMLTSTYLSISHVNFRAPSNGGYEDITLDASSLTYAAPPAADYRYSYGAHISDAAAVNSYLRRTRINGCSDCIYVKKSSSSIYVYDSFLASQFDAVVTSTATYCTLWNSHVTVTGPDPQLESECHGVSGNVTMYGGSIVVRNGGVTNYGATTDISAGITVWLFGTQIFTSNAGSSILTFTNVTGGTFTLTVTNGLGAGTTSPITWTSALDRGTIQSALEALSNVGAGNAPTSGIANGIAYSIILPAGSSLTVNGSGLTGTGAAAAISAPVTYDLYNGGAGSINVCAIASDSATWHAGSGTINNVPLAS